MIEKKRKERFETLPTKIPGIQLRAEPGSKISSFRRVVKTFYHLAKQFAEVYFQKEILDGLSHLCRKKIIALVKEHEGLRGVSSKTDNFVLTVIPIEKTIWNQEELKKSLGVAYSTVVREILVINISIPVGFVTKKKVIISEEGVERAVRKALVGLGLSEEELNKVMHREVNITLDEKKLAEMQNLGQVSLSKEVKTTETSWRISVDRLEN